MEDWYVANATILVAIHNNILTNPIRNDHMIAITPARQGDSDITQNSSITTSSDMAMINNFHPLLTFTCN